MQTRILLILCVVTCGVTCGVNSSWGQAPTQPTLPASSYPLATPNYPLTTQAPDYYPVQGQPVAPTYPPIAQPPMPNSAPTPSTMPAPLPNQNPTPNQLPPRDLPPTPMERGDFQHGTIYQAPPVYEPSRRWDSWDSCDPDFRNRWWIGVGIFMGYAERGTFPSSWTVPATGTAVGFGTSRQSQFNTGLILDGGFWLDREQTHGIDASYLDFYSHYHMWDTMPINPIGATAGTDGRASQTTEFWSADVNYRHKLVDQGDLRLDGMVGFRFAELWESANVHTLLTDSTGNIFDFLDRATAKNYFYGGQLGLSSKYRSGLWEFSAAGKVALGGMHSSVSFKGDSAATIASGASTATIPSLSKTQFAVMPTVSLNVSRLIWHTTRVYVGYDFQYLNHTVRATDVYGPFAGAALSADKGFWVQGIRLGLETRY